MTGLEKLKVIIQVATNLEGLHRDMRANANAYKAAVGTKPAATIIAIMKADADEYLRRLGWHDALTAGHRSELSAFAALLGIDGAEMVDDHQLLKSVATDLKNANLTTNAHINNASDQILAAVPARLALY
jgi:hypothetical protein